MEKAVKKDLRALLTDHVKGNQILARAAVADFAIKYKHKGVDFFIEHPCHAQLRWGRYDDPHAKEEIKGIALYVNGWYNDISKSEKESYLTYIKWVLKESPWAVCFKTKTAKTAIEKGVTMNVDRNVSELVGAAIALREGWEFSNRLPIFKEALENGATLPSAYLVGCCLLKDGDRYSLNSLLGGHTALCGTMDFRALMAFFREGYEEGLNGIRKDQNQTSYRVFDTITSRARKTCSATEQKDRFLEYVTAVVKPVKVGEGWHVKTVVDKAGMLRLIEFFNKETAK